MPNRDRYTGPPAQASPLPDQPLKSHDETRLGTPSVISQASLSPASSLEHTPKVAYDLDHLALLHHVEHDMIKPPHTHFVANEADAGPLLQLIMKSALSASYFMDELLGFAALHLSVLTDDAAEKIRYRHQAVYLQTRALASFNTLAPEITDKNCTIIFLFSSFTAMHMLHDTVATERDLLELLERFIQFVHLYRGLGAITDRGWHVIRKSELRSIFDLIEAVDRVEMTSGRECEKLAGLLSESSDQLGSEPTKACLAALNSLQGVFNQYNTLPGPMNRHVVLGWPVHLSTEYLTLLNMRQPEALVILAYWAVLLHYGRSFWVFGDAGRFLVQAISKFLGKHWGPWMEWPKQAIESHAPPPPRS
ncbi:Upc2 protein [Colletotrichum truncatum]|uniref:Upc2 protein n=1 Tax=Colletotrichum truncatum TaxID=5467 RepID=A0ACC3YQ08_COLTU